MSLQQIDFYLLPTDNERHRLLFACRLINKIYALDKQVFVLTADDRQTRHMDQLLWTWSPGSFTPHRNCLDSEQPEAPVYIGHDAPPAAFSDVMLNLTGSAPDCRQQFQRLLELVGNGEADRQKARARFKIYRDSGIEPKTVNIKTL